MLWVPKCTFEWSTDNSGTTYTDAGLGTGLTAGGTNHTKAAAATTLLAGSVILQDVYWVKIGFVAGATSGASNRFLVDFYCDPAGGTAWETAPRIANLAANSPSLTQGGVWYEFLLFIKAGTSIGAIAQAQVANTTVRVLIGVSGQPTRPESVQVGTKVTTYGAALASTTGGAITIGANGALPATYTATFATTTADHWWWQTGILCNDTSQAAVQYWFDFAAGDANRKQVIQRGLLHHNVGTVEAAGRANMSGLYAPLRFEKSGTLLYMNGVCTGTADSNWSALVYAVT